MRILIIMGSDSDLPVMKPAADICKELGIECSMTVASAHRTPEKVRELAQGAEEKGIGAIIVGAGGAAHLAGVVASYTTLPVIGVPINATPLNGMDALFATVQMPSGIPVATMAVNGAKNAAILAAEIFALSDAALKEKLSAYRKKLAEAVEKKAAKVEGA